MDTFLSNEFRVGLRIMVIDEDISWLRLLEKMLLRCMYSVTSCSQKSVASNLLQEKKGCFDLVLSDVQMHDMDGFKLLERVGLEMKLPVIVMSTDGRTDVVMQAIRHGACEILIKPICEEQLKLLWQHVARKKWNENRENGGLKLHTDDNGNATSFTNNEEDSETESVNPSAAKKRRVVWTMELHQKFMSVENQLGTNRLAPKRILELMNVPELTRENVASHLQKYRQYFKGTNQDGIPSPNSGPVEHSAHPSSFSVFQTPGTNQDEIPSPNSGPVEHSAHPSSFGVFHIPRPISYFSPGLMNPDSRIPGVARQVPLVSYTIGNAENMIEMNPPHDNGPVGRFGFPVDDPQLSSGRKF